MQRVAGHHRPPPCPRDSPVVPARHPVRWWNCSRSRCSPIALQRMWLAKPRTPVAQERRRPLAAHRTPVAPIRIASTSPTDARAGSRNSARSHRRWPRDHLGGSPPDRDRSGPARARRHDPAQHGGEVHEIGLEAFAAPFVPPGMEHAPQIVECVRCVASRCSILRCACASGTAVEGHHCQRAARLPVVHHPVGMLAVEWLRLPTRTARSTSPARTRREYRPAAAMPRGTAA